MIDQHERLIPVIAALLPGDEDLLPDAEIRLDLPFSRSNGTMLSRLYERLTKASRRRQDKPKRLAWGEKAVYDWVARESAYRQGVYDAYKALQDELEA